MDISLGFIAAAIAVQLLVFYLPDVVSANKDAVKSVAKMHEIFYAADLLIFLVWLKLLLLCF